jgi:alpha-mannosidase
MFAEIQQRVKEGRWRVVGGWWVEPDCNIPHGESLVRQGLYGQRYFLDRFGITARVGFNVDSFGHSGALPQILKKCGLKYYTFLRPMPHEKSLPSRLFHWESDDGSQVLAFRIPFEYLSGPEEIDNHIKRCASEMKEPLDEMMCYYGVGNHGGGPTQKNIESIHENDQHSEELHIFCSFPEQFFKNVEAKDWHLPVVHDEMQNHAQGCYAAHSGVKKWNRVTEHRLLAAEKWSLLAENITGQPYPLDMERAWKKVLFNQFHDILAGTSLESAYQDARDTYGEARAIADRGINTAVQSFLWNIQIDPVENMKPIVVFNPHTWPISANVELETDPWEENAVLLDDQGQRVPHQEVQSATITSRQRLSFAADLPALGYRTYRLLPEGASQAQRVQVKASDALLENEVFRLEFDPESGYIDRLWDKRAKVNVFGGQAAKPEVIHDPYDTWGHNSFRYDQLAGAFRAQSVRLVEHGPVKSVVRVRGQYEDSYLIQDFTLYPDRDQIDVFGEVNWQEQHKMLKLRFPVNVKFMKVTREIPYGHIEHLADGSEAPFQRWVDVSGTSRDREMTVGFSLINNSKYSLDVNVHDIGLTILRSPAYAHHDPSEPEPEAHYHYLDQGIQCFQYTMYPHLGSWETADTVQRAAECNQPPIALFGTFHEKGSLPQTNSYINVDSDHVMVTVLKKAEDENGVILRAYETKGAAVQASIHLPVWNKTIQASFNPSEIKTFLIPQEPDQPIIETDFIERAL